MQRIVKDLYSLFSGGDARKMSKDAKRRSSNALATSAFEEMDANADGKVTKAEFIEACHTNSNISNMLVLRIVDIFITEDTGDYDEDDNDDDDEGEEEN